MRGDEVSRNRSVLLARWRAAAALERAPARVSESPPPSEVKPFTPGAGDEATLFQRFEEELRSALPRAAADTIGRILAAPRAAVLTERTPESLAVILSKLDLVEDVLDAILLAGGAPSGEAEGEPP
jgi:hypothetical protein